MADDKNTNAAKSSQTTRSNDEEARRKRVEARKAKEADEQRQKDGNGDLPASGGGAEKEVVEVRVNKLNRMDDPTDADPTDLAEPNQFSSSSDPVAEVYVPATKVTETLAGEEIRPETEPPTFVRVNPEDQLGMIERTYGRHSGKVGHTVPIVDDFHPVNPRKGGIIGGQSGPGAVGRVREEQRRNRAADALIDSLVEGTDAAEKLRQEEAKASTEGKTAYMVASGSIFTENGKHVPGDKVYLSSEEAKRFNAAGRLAPWID